MKKQLIILIYLFVEILIAYAIVNNIFDLPNEYIIIIAPVMIQLVKQTVKQLKKTKFKNTL